MELDKNIMKNLFITFDIISNYYILFKNLSKFIHNNIQFKSAYPEKKPDVLNALKRFTKKRKFNGIFRRYFLNA